MSEYATAEAREQMDDHPVFRRKLLEQLNSPEQLDQMMTVTSSRGWLALVTLGLLTALIFAWSMFARIESTVAGSGVLVPLSAEAQALEAIVYVSVRDGERIRSGQSVKVAPRAFRQEEYGLVQGIVQEVSHTPATYEDMLLTLGNDALAQSLISEGLIIQVRLGLVRADTASGYMWTTAAGPPTDIIPGTLAQASFVIDAQRPIALIWTH